jgi:CRP/FNR family cyclic AMP-dependent transcriptional regulator
MATGIDEKLELLKRSPVLAGLTRKELGEVEQLADEVDVPAGRVLMREGSIGSEFFVIVDGQVVIDRGGRTVRTMGPGEFFGDIALITERPRSAGGTALTDCRLLVLGHREFHSLLDKFPSIRMTILESIALRLRDLEPDSAH